MSLRQRRLRADYRRALKIGLGVSIMVHVLALMLGRFEAELPSNKSNLTAMALLELEIPDEEEVMEIVDLTDPAAAGNDAAMELSDQPGQPNTNSTDMAFVTPDAMNEAAYILARASSAHLEFSVVPKPDVAPMTVETAFSPMYETEEATQLIADMGVTRKSSGRRGGGIRISVGAGGHCPIPTRMLINRRAPVANSFGRAGPTVGGSFRGF